MDAVCAVDVLPVRTLAASPFKAAPGACDIGAYRVLAHYEPLRAARAFDGHLAPRDVNIGVLVLELHLHDPGRRFLGQLDLGPLLRGRCRLARLWGLAGRTHVL